MRWTLKVLHAGLQWAERFSVTLLTNIVLPSHPLHPRWRTQRIARKGYGMWRRLSVAAGYLAGTLVSEASDASTLVLL